MEPVEVEFLTEDQLPKPSKLVNIGIEKEEVEHEAMSIIVNGQPLRIPASKTINYFAVIKCPVCGELIYRQQIKDDKTSTLIKLYHLIGKAKESFEELVKHCKVCGTKLKYDGRESIETTYEILRSE